MYQIDRLPFSSYQLVETQQYICSSRFRVNLFSGLFALYIPLIILSYQATSYNTRSFASTGSPPTPFQIINLYIVEYLWTISRYTNDALKLEVMFCLDSIGMPAPAALPLATPNNALLSQQTWQQDCVCQQRRLLIVYRSPLLQQICQESHPRYHLPLSHRSKMRTWMLLTSSQTIRTLTWLYT